MMAHLPVLEARHMGGPVRSYVAVGAVFCRIAESRADRWPVQSLQKRRNFRPGCRRR